ncbi:hypothetical protein QP938_11160 [Porticoccaceae bacterium LTM1]|nr:hypothetical protein QP938_11160 [Porticoccaceae bacterium LTM1]
MKTKLFAFLAGGLFVASAWADGNTIDKIYTPYVQPLEKELEYQLLVERDDPETEDQRLRHKFGFGSAVSEHLFVEGYALFSDTDNLEHEGYELEFRYQLTEQGEYDSDWGVMFELERESEDDKWEAAVGLLNTREWKNWLITTNLFVIREWGSHIDAELETTAALQAKYRQSPNFEPGLELFVSQDTLAIGPAFSGQWKTTTSDKLLWQFGVYWGVKDETPDTTVKFQLEYEFF